jgi:hypothetical protein
VLSQIEAALSEGAILELDGRGFSPDSRPMGNWLGATVRQLCLDLTEYVTFILAGGR